MSSRMHRRVSRSWQTHEQRTSFWRTQEMEHVQSLGTTNLYLTNTRVVGHGLEVRGGMVWRWGEGKAYSRVLAQTFLGEISCWDDIPLKRGKDELEPLGACHEG